LHANEIKHENQDETNFDVGVPPRKKTKIAKGEPITDNDGQIMSKTKTKKYKK